MKLHKKLIWSLGIALVVAAPLLGVVSATVGQASAAGNATGIWIDHSHIDATIDGKHETLTDGQIDNNLSYTYTYANCKSADTVNGFGSDATDSSNATRTVNLTYWRPSTVPGQTACVQTSVKIAMSDPNNAFQTYFVWQDGNTIVASDGKSGTFVSDGNGNFVVKSGNVWHPDSSCKSYIVPGSDNSTGALHLQYTAGQIGNFKGWPGISDALQDYTQSGTQGSCRIATKVLTFTLGDATNNSNSPGGGNGSTCDPSTSVCTSATSNDLDPCNATGDPLTWFICPVIGILHEATDALQAIINHLMEIDVKSIFDTSTDSGKAYYTAWNSFRILGLAVIVISGLVMVISQSLGMDLFDAYTVKKVLPRLVVAGIGISLSWWAMKFMVEVTDDLGIGVRSLIYAPFQSLAGSTGAQNWASALYEDLFIGGAFALLGLAGMGTLVLTGLLAALVAFLVLIIRQILIVMLILVAPIAIACYVLPNTQKAYHLWWDSLSKGLLMFPFITAFIATGQVFSIVAAGDTSGSFSINKVIGMIAYFLPYFALPYTFRLAGGALATIGGLTNDRSRGLFDGLRNKRKAITADRFKRMQNSTLWDNNNPIGKRANRVASWITDPGSNAMLATKDVPILRAVTGKRGYGVASALDAAKAKQTGELFKEVNEVFGDNDKAYRVMAGQFGGMSAGTQALLTANGFGNEESGWKAPKSLKQLQKVSDILSQSDTETERSAGLAINSSMGRLANLYRDPEMAKANVQAAGILGLAAHGFSDGDDISGTYNGLVASGESEGFANAVSQQAQVYVARSRPDAKAGYGTTVETDSNGKRIQVSGLRQMDETGHVVSIENADGSFNEDALGLRGFDVIDAIAPGDYAQAKGGFLRKLGKKNGGLGSHLEFILRNGTTQEASEAATRVADIKKAAAANPQDEAAQKAVQDLKKTPEGRRLSRLAKASRQYVSVRDSLLQAGSYYSHASSDIKAQANDLLRTTATGDNNHELLLEQYNAARSGGHNPNEHDEGGNHPDPGTQPPGMGPPGS